MITCLCLYHGRNWCLHEAVECYLRQTDRQNTELFILNDCQEQRIICDIPGVRVENSHYQFQDLSDKYNYGVRESKGDFIILWDDDDISLPRRIDNCKSIWCILPYYRAYVPRLAWYMENDQIVNLSEHLYAGAMWFEKEYWIQYGGAVNNKPPDRSAYENMMKSTYGVYNVRTTVDYIYRWGRDAHDSKHKFNNNQDRAEAFDRKVKSDPRYIAGDIVIKPKWNQDYVALVQEAIRNGVPRI